MRGRFLRAHRLQGDSDPESGTFPGIPVLPHPWTGYAALNDDERLCPQVEKESFRVRSSLQQMWNFVMLRQAFLLTSRIRTPVTNGVVPETVTVALFM